MTIDVVALCRLSSSAWDQLAESEGLGSLDDLFHAPDPLTFTRLAWLGLHDPMWKSQILQQLGVAFTEALEQSHTVPLGFAHAVIEGARQHCLLHHSNLAWTAATLKLLKNAELAEIDTPKWLALSALATIFHADELEVSQKSPYSVLAAKQMTAAARLVQPDIGSRIAEVSATIVFKQQCERYVETYQALTERLAACANLSPGRWAVVLNQRSQLHVHHGKFEAALSTLRLASRQAEQAGRDDRLLLEILHQQFHMLVVLRRYKDAEAMLPRYTALLDSPVSDGLLKAEHKHLLGRIALDRGEISKAVELYIEAVTEMMLLGNYVKAAKAAKDIYAARLNERIL